MQRFTLNGRPTFIRKFLLILTLTTTLTACGNRELPKPTSEERTIWQESQTFTVSGNQMIGQEGRIAFTYDETKLIPGHPTKVIWHFWGAPEDLSGPFYVMATSQDRGEQIRIITAHQLAGPQNGADAHLPTIIELPDQGLWKLDAFLHETLYGSIYVHVKKGS